MSIALQARTGVLLGFSCFLLVASAWASVDKAPVADIATVLGHPDDRLDFVHSLVTERHPLGKARYEEEMTTRIYSVLARRGVHSAVSVEVLDAYWTTTSSILQKAFQLAAKKAPVVYSNIGPSNDSLCSVMRELPDTAFVLVAGNDAGEIDPRALPNCAARNILRVAALDQSRGVLEDFASWGTLVRLAAPSHQLRTIGPEENVKKQTSTALGTALVAGRLAAYGRKNPELKGAALIGAFLKESTVHLPALDAKVEGGLALDDTGF